MYFILKNGFPSLFSLPQPGAIELTAHEEALVQNVPAGKVLKLDSNGRPVLADRPASELLAQAQTEKKAALTTECAATITGGFPSSALGSSYSYPSKPTDQANLVACVTASLLPGNTSSWATKFWCEDSSGGWAFREHTAAQIQKVGQDGKSFIESQQAQLETLKAKVDSATTVSDVDAISWSPA